MIFSAVLISLVSAQMQPGMGMGPPIIPGMPFFDCESVPPQFCNLLRTKGQCVALPSQKKCDLAEKCNGRAKSDCSKYWTGTLEGPNCVWLQEPGMEGKCDESTKCQGRSRALCTNPNFPSCGWQWTSMLSGFCSDGGGGGFLQKTHKVVGEGSLQPHQIQNAEDVQKETKSTNLLENVPLLAVGGASFVFGIAFALIICRCKSQRGNAELNEALDLERRI